jgi:sortase A
MKDPRLVDDLSVEELERILLIKRREARLARLRDMDRPDRAVGRDPLEPQPPPPVPLPISTAHRQFQGIGASASYHSVELQDSRWQPLRDRLQRSLSVLPRINWRFVFNGILLAVEATAVIGLIVIFVIAWQDRQEINEEAEELFVPPTPAITIAPLTRAVVLPGGHTPPDTRGFSQPEPIPDQLRALAESIPPHPVPTRGPEHATRIIIPSIGVDHPIVLGDDWEALKRGVGHTPWSANPGKVGNCVLSAYNDIFGAIFRRLHDMELGDEIFVHTSSQVYRYLVRATRIVDPTQVEVMEPTDHPVLTLISSYPYLVDDKRIVVIAELDQE